MEKAGLREGTKDFAPTSRKLLSSEPELALQSILFQQQHEGTSLHVNKKLIALEQNKNQVIVRFEDGTEDTGHILIGSDGIHLSIGSYV
jgi:2-polyprenyl-6-methoxyphenol hydroxylase-like FAD-dependent oxidoreductase